MEPLTNEVLQIFQNVHAILLGFVF